ncbi:unnamed protein product [Urochloa humidicola]
MRSVSANPPDPLHNLHVAPNSLVYNLNIRVSATPHHSSPFFPSSRQAPQQSAQPAQAARRAHPSSPRFSPRAATRHRARPRSRSARARARLPSTAGGRPPSAPPPYPAPSPHSPAPSNSVPSAGARLPLPELPRHRPPVPDREHARRPRLSIRPWVAVAGRPLDARHPRPHGRLPLSPTARLPPARRLICCWQPLRVCSCNGK